MNDNTRVPERADVVIIGAGLSGMVSATELARAGITDVIVLEARDRIGGRLEAHIRPNGRVLMSGGEMTGPSYVQLGALAESLGIGIETPPALQQGGKFVRRFNGERFVESYPLESDPEAAEAYQAAAERLSQMVAETPADAPWSAPSAREWDTQTFGQWLGSNVPSAAAREMLAAELAHAGNPHEISLLSILWFFARMGGWESAHQLVDGFVGGTAQIPLRLAEKLQGQIFTSRAVRRIAHSDDGVVVHYDGGQIAARAAVLTIEPGQAARIEFSPGLPPARDRLQSRWVAGHGAKFAVVYDTPFWREEGLAGFGIGSGPFEQIVDLTSPSIDDEAILTVFYFDSGPAAALASAAIAKDPTYRTAVLDTLVTYFGERAREPREFYAFNWTGDHWSQGCSTQLPPGVLSTVGYTLREPIGRLIWAGTETGDVCWMEGAVTAGQRAAREAQALAATP